MGRCHRVFADISRSDLAVARYAIGYSPLKNNDLPKMLMASISMLNYQMVHVGIYVIYIYRHHLQKAFRNTWFTLIQIGHPMDFVRLGGKHIDPKNSDDLSHVNHHQQVRRM